jgi:hypothetical protein
MSHLITDDNYLFAVEKVAELTDGTRGLLPRDYSKVPMGAIPHTSPFVEAVPIIPESEWPARIAAMQGKWIRYLYPGNAKDDYQNGLGYCWAFSLAQSAMMIRALEGQSYKLLLAESLGYDVNWRNAGNYCSSAIEAAGKTGFCEASYSPARFNLKPSTWKPGWQENGLQYRITEWWELGNVNMRQEVATAMMLGFPVYTGYNRFSHAIALDECGLDGKTFWVHSPNTHGPGEDWTLKGTVAIPDEAYVPRVLVRAET